MSKDNELIERITEIAVNLCPDYPDIESGNLNGFQMLWAIEQGFIGTNLACKDLRESLKSSEARVKAHEKDLIRVSALLDEHPEDYDGVCMCKECRDCIDIDDGHDSIM